MGQASHDHTGTEFYWPGQPGWTNEYGWRGPATATLNEHLFVFETFPLKNVQIISI